MAKVRVDLKTELLNGQTVVFKAPCDCTDVTGLVARYSDGTEIKEVEFTFKDAHGENVAGLGNLFVKGAYVKVILDTTTKSAFIQNADTNSYLERFDIQTSNDYELRNSKASVLNLNYLEGNTEQKTLSGKNLWSFGDVVVDDIYTTKQLKLESGSYTISSVIDSSNTNAPSFLMLFTLASGTSKYVQLPNNNDVRKAVTVTFDESVTKVLLYASNDNSSSSGHTTTYSDVQIELGSVATPYEEFCGGPSPNPSFPQAIENTFDCVEMINGNRNTTNGTLATSTLSVCNKVLVPCKSGDIVKIKCDKAHTYIYSILFNGSTFVSGAYKDNVSEYEFTIPSGVNLFGFNISNRNGVTPQTVGKITLTVNGKYVGQIPRRNKNIFTKFKAHSVASVQDTMPIDVKPNTDYTVSIKDTTVNGRLYVKDTNGNQLFIYPTDDVFRGGVPKFTFNTGNNETIMFQINNTSQVTGTLPNATETIPLLNASTQLEEGANATEYVTPIEEVTTFFLNEPLRAEDRIVRKDGVIGESHRSKTVVLTGNENIVKNTGFVNTNAFYIEPLEGYTSNSVVRSTHYSVTNDSNASNDGLYLGSKLHFLTDLSHNYTATTFKTYLAEQYANGTPVTLEYTVAEETFTPLDTESQLALNSLETFDGVTYIEVDSKVKPSAISGEYAASTVAALALEHERKLDDLYSRVQYVDVDVSGGALFYKITPPDNFTIYNSIIIAYDHILDDGTIYHNSMVGIDTTDSANSFNFPTHASFRRNTTVGCYTLNTTMLGAISCSLEGTLRVYFLRIS